MSEQPEAQRMILVRGAREHNLKNLTLSLPRDALTVITGPSGSGKSSLAFDTIYAEAERRFVESLSVYARQFLEQALPPDVDAVEGLSPAIAVTPQTAIRSPRSTVGTATEIHDYLRVLFAAAGTPWCPGCGRVLTRETPQTITDRIEALPERSKVQLLAPVVRAAKGSHKRLLRDLMRRGFVRVRVDEEIFGLEQELALDPAALHDIDVVVDRIIVKEGIRDRVTDSVEASLRLGDGLVRLLIEQPDGHSEDRLLSERFGCLDCGLMIPRLEPRLFSFNNPHGACPACSGMGRIEQLDPARIVPDPSKSLRDHAVLPWSSRGKREARRRRDLRRFCERQGISFEKPWKKLSETAKRLVLYGPDGADAKERRRFEGVIPSLARRFEETASENVRDAIRRFMADRVCPECRGARLRKEALAVRLGGKSIAEVSAMTPVEAADFLASVPAPPETASAVEPLRTQLLRRLSFLQDSGLEYLSLDRSADTLSSGELQRIRLASQLGTGLSGVLYVLDEPSTGLHPRDTDRLLRTLGMLQQMGNTLVIVEHELEIIRRADYIVDLGPGAGPHGGEIVATGSPDEVASIDASVTGRFLRRTAKGFTRDKRRRRSKRILSLKGASLHNLRGIDVEIPLGMFVCVSGVSGSGKSSLIMETLLPKALETLHGASPGPSAIDAINGLEHLDKVIAVDQSPIGRTPRSTPATYLGVFDLIRDLFAQIPEARVRGYDRSRFSYNVKGGRCEECQGAGMKRIEMHFLPDMYVRCPVCEGSRYNRDTLEIRYRGRSIADVLEMTVGEAGELFQSFRLIRAKLDSLVDVGLGYLTLGQSAATLSGGEAQRVKLATELSKRQTGRTLYVLDEPTTGLHAADVEVLLALLHRLVDQGNSVIVVEHDLSTLASADWLIDLGPDAGSNGGTLVAEGTPEQVKKHRTCHTATYLRRFLEP